MNPEQSAQPTSGEHGGLTQADEEHLRLLSIFHYVVAAMQLVFCSFPLLHVALGLAIVSGEFPQGTSGQQPFPDLVGWFFVALPGSMVLLGWTSAVLVAMAGRRLARRQQRTFCMVVAAIECFFMPVGTALGVFTILVLSRDSVRQAFG